MSSQQELLTLGRRLEAEGRPEDALIIFGHLVGTRPWDRELRASQLSALAAARVTPQTLQQLAQIREAAPDSVPETMIRAQASAGVLAYDQCITGGDMERAETFAAALARLLPYAAPMQATAMNCNSVLGRTERAATFARALLTLEPEDAAAHEVVANACQDAGDEQGEMRHRLHAVMAEPNNLHPLVRLKSCHDIAGRLLSQPLTEESWRQLSAVLPVAARIELPADADEELQGWAKHYGLLLAAIDLQAIAGETPADAGGPPDGFVDGTGAPRSLAEVRRQVAESGAETVFFVAADEAYVDLYARWYVLSVLKYCDVERLIVVHVVGGAGRLPEIARKVGVADRRLVFTADTFDPAGVTVKCWEAPPMGLSNKPKAHYQCVRFQRLGALLEAFGLPVFVSDIDLLLQRGVSDLLARCAETDVVLNQNEGSKSAGARITANLLLLRPTAPAHRMLRFLRGFFDKALAGAEVTRWIDQVALLQAWHHLAAWEPQAKVGYFDTKTDINNVIYRSYQANPFRFFSLYHGFDTSSLEQLEDAGEPAATARPRRRAKA